MGTEDMRDFASRNPNANTGIELRFFANDIEKERVFKSQNFRPPHIRAGSTLVAPIGVMWEPGAWQKTVDMVIKTNKSGVCCWLHEMVDINAGIPAEHLNMMRDTACMYAHDTGFEWVLLIENDALPEEDMLINLLKWDMPVVVPYIIDKVFGKPICSPFYKKGSGLQPVQWAVFTCILLNVKVLNCFPYCQPFSTVGIESGLFHKLRHFGHKVYQDTNTELDIARRPTYPVDYGGLEEEWKGWVAIDKKRRQIPDRKPIDPKEERVINGIYMPMGTSGTLDIIGGSSGTERAGGKEEGSGEGVQEAGNKKGEAKGGVQEHTD
jgi:hypothetical protein